MFNNPLIKRFRCGSMRPKQVLIYSGIYICVVFLIVLLNYLYYVDYVTSYWRSNIGSLDTFARTTYGFLLAVQVFMCWFWCTNNSGLAIRNEITRNSYDFFSLLPLSACQKVVGILIGTNLLPLLFAAINCALLVLFGSLGNLAIAAQANVLLTTFSVAVLLNTIFLLSSLSMKATKQLASPALPLLIFCFFFLLPGLLLLSEKSLDSLLAMTTIFYGARISTLHLVSFVCLYHSAWAFLGILRKIDNPEKSLFSDQGALLFFIGFEHLVTGFCWPFLRHGAIKAVFANWAITLVMLFSIACGTTRTFADYFDRARALRLPAEPSARGVFRLLAISNTWRSLYLAAVWVMFSICVLAVAGWWWLPNFLWHVLILPTFFFFLTSLLDIHSLYQASYEKIKPAIGFVIFLYLFLPLMLAPITGEHVAAFSVFGYFGYLNSMVTASGNVLQSLPLWHVVGWNLGLGVVAILIVTRKFRNILEECKKMGV